jgi:hypothetical protein
MKNTQPHVKSVQEYFALSRSEREVCGFYRVPFSLPWTIYDDSEGWSGFYRKIAKEYPVQFFFRVWLFSYSNPIYVFIKHKVCCPLNSVKARILNLWT